MNRSFSIQAGGRAVCLCLLFVCQYLGAQFVELTAEFETVTWTPHPQETSPRANSKTWTLHCVIGSNSWLMENSADSATIESLLFTGSNVVVHSVLARIPSERKELFERNHPDMIVGRGQTAVLQSNGELPGLLPIFTGAFPVALNHPYYKVPWLAFCSGSFLKRDGRKIPLPEIGIPLQVDYRDTTTVYEDGLGLPKSIDMSTTNKLGVCLYRVSESTNVLGWNFPMKFYFAQLSSKPPDPIWTVCFTAQGKVTQIGPSGPPQIPTQAQKAIEK